MQTTDSCGCEGEAVHPYLLHPRRKEISFRQPIVDPQRDTHTNCNLCKRLRRKVQFSAFPLLALFWFCSPIGTGATFTSVSSVHFGASDSTDALVSFNCERDKNRGAESDQRLTSLSILLPARRHVELTKRWVLSLSSPHKLVPNRYLGTAVV